MERGDSSRPASFAVWGSLVALAILTAILRLPFAAEPPGRDQGLFVTEATLLASGGQLYADVWEHKQPGIVALYGAAMTIASPDYLAIQWLHALAGFVTAALLVLLFRRIGCSTRAGFCAGALYLLFYGGPIFGGFWATAQVEIFLDPCVVAALHGLLPRGVAERPAFVRLFAAGVAFGIAVLWLKYSSAPLVGLALLALWNPASSVSLTLRRSFAPLALVASGMGAVALVMLLYFGASGRVGEFWDATVLFNLSHSQVSAFRPESFARWIAMLFIWPGELAVLYGFSAVALFGRFIAGTGSAAAAGRASRDWLLAAGFALWLLALAEVVIQGKFWVYHYHVILLPLSILAGLGFEWAGERLAVRIGARAGPWVAALVALVLLWPHAQLLSDYVALHRVAAFHRAELDRDAFLASYRWGSGGDFDAAENLRVAARVAAETVPGERLFVWGFEPSIYWLSGRAAASRFLYDYPLMPELAGVHDRHLEWLMEDLEASQPSLFLVLRRDANDLESHDSAAQLQQLPPLRAYLDRHYRPVWREGDFSAFRRQPPARVGTDGVLRE